MSIIYMAIASRSSEETYKLGTLDHGKYSVLIIRHFVKLQNLGTKSSKKKSYLCSYKIPV